jgi:pyruvate/2-oxoglutarate dehydrogenase complex dihydrolipoamide dehydrogenase (E3) component
MKNHDASANPKAPSPETRHSTGPVKARRVHSPAAFQSKPEPVDVLILGSGQGGKLLAWHMARSGHRTAVVERQWVGGSCPAVACLPSKNEIWSARVAHLARAADRFGTLTGAVRTDMAKVRGRKQRMIDRETAFHLNAYKSSGAELIMASGCFVGPRLIEARLNDGGTRLLKGSRVFVNVGSRAAIPNVPGLEAARPLTHIEALELDSLPRHLIVLGGGYTGLELAQAYRRFGSRVTIIEPGPHVMSREDPDVAAEMQRMLREEGIEILAGAPPSHVEGRSGERVTVTVHAASGEQRIEGSDILVATGRIPNTAGIGLEDAGIELDGRGFIRVNDRLETTAAGVWAIGECAGSPHFTHASVDDFRIVRDNLAGGSRSTKDRLMPYCVFTDPPLAHVGLSEVDARRQRIAVRIAKLPMSGVLRTEATDETQGFMKVLVSKADDRILGFTMIGSEAGEVMAAVQTAMLAGLPYPTLRDAVITHLTVAEGLGPLLSNVEPRTEQILVSENASLPAL